MLIAAPLAAQVISHQTRTSAIRSDENQGCLDGRKAVDLAWQFPDPKIQNSQDCFAYASVALFEAALARKTRTHFNLSEEYAVFRQRRYGQRSSLLQRKRSGDFKQTATAGHNTEDFARYLLRNPEALIWKTQISKESYHSATAKALEENLAEFRELLQQKGAQRLMQLSRKSFDKKQKEICRDFPSCNNEENRKLQELLKAADLTLTKVATKSLNSTEAEKSKMALLSATESLRAESVKIFTEVQKHLPEWFLVNCLYTSETGGSLGPALLEDQEMKKCIEKHDPESLEPIRLGLIRLEDLYRGMSGVVARYKTDSDQCLNIGRQLERDFRSQLCKGLPISISFVNGVDENNRVLRHAAVISGFMPGSTPDGDVWLVRDSAFGKTVPMPTRELCRIENAFVIQ